jgi:hypothetical protein
VNVQKKTKINYFTTSRTINSDYKKIKKEVFLSAAEAIAIFFDNEKVTNPASVCHTVENIHHRYSHKRRRAKQRRHLYSKAWMRIRRRCPAASRPPHSRAVASSNPPCLQPALPITTILYDILLCFICRPVFRIHDILVWIRIRIHGSMPLTNGSGSCYFRH